MRALPSSFFWLIRARDLTFGPASYLGLSPIVLLLHRCQRSYLSVGCGKIGTLAVGCVLVAYLYLGQSMVLFLFLFLFSLYILFFPLSSLPIQDLLYCSFSVPILYKRLLLFWFCPPPPSQPLDKEKTKRKKKVKEKGNDRCKYSGDQPNPHLPPSSQTHNTHSIHTFASLVRYFAVQSMLFCPLTHLLLRLLTPFYFPPFHLSTFSRPCLNLSTPPRSLSPLTFSTLP